MRYNSTVPRPWTTLAHADTDEGRMTLMRRGDEFLIRMRRYILMSSRNHRSEKMLGQAACDALGHRKAPRLLVAGLGMGFTLRAVLDELPSNARVDVAELNPVVVEWCRGPLRTLTDGAVDDPRVEVRVTDVRRLIAAAASHGPAYDAVVLDLYQGTHDANSERGHPFYGRRALERTRRALTDGGVLAVWTEYADRGFEERLDAVGFNVERRRTGKGGPRYVVYLGRKVPRKRAAPSTR